MPKIIYNKSGGKIIYDSDDWLAGMDAVQNSAYQEDKSGNGLTSGSTGVDALRSLGYVVNGFNAVDVTTVAQATSFIKNGVVKGDSAYLISSGSIVHKLDTLTAGTLNATNPFPYTIAHGAHTGEAGDDIVNYYVGTVLKAFFSFNDDTDWDVGVFDYVADAFDPDFMSTIPTNPLADNWGGVATNDFLTTLGKGYPHPLIVGDDDVLYMGSGRYIHAYDGATNTFYGAVLTLPAGWIVTCLAKTSGNNLAIGAYYSSSQSGSTYNKGEAKVWIWNYLELDPSAYYDLNDNYISELFNWRGTLACFTSGKKSISRRGNNKLQVFDGSKFVPIVEYYTGGIPRRGGVDTVGEDIYWNALGTIYSYNKIPNTDKFIFNRLNSPEYGSSGMLKFFTTTSIMHFSGGAGAGNGGLMSFGSNYGEAATAICKYAVPNFPTDKKGKLTSIEITFKEVASGGRSLAVNIDIDGATPVVAAAFTAVVATNLKVKYKERSDGTNLGMFTKVRPVLIWADGSGATASPTVEKVEFEFEFVNI